MKKYFKRVLNYLLHGIEVKHVTAQIVSMSPSELLCGRAAFITGGTRGIGYSIAKAFVNAGAYVVITGRDSHMVKEACDKINFETSNNRAYGIAMDITKPETFSQLFQEILEIVPTHKIDILVNNAGVIGSFGFAGLKESIYDNVLDTNLKGPVLLSSIVGKYMRDNEIEGNILNIESSSSVRPANSAYGISKWGMRGFTLGLAKSLLPYNIIVNGLAPGPTATEMILKDPKKGIERNGLLGRHILPEEIANMSVIMVSAMGRTIVGDTIYMTTGCGIVTFDDISCNF